MLQQKHLFALATALLLCFIFSSSVVAQDYIVDAYGGNVKAPEFHEPGYKNFSEWVQEHIVYPETAKINKMEGVVRLYFVVEKDGSVSNARVYNSLGLSINKGEEDISFAPDLDKEAIRVVLSSPKWTPGQLKDDNGVPSEIIRTRVPAMVEFSLSGGAYEEPLNYETPVDQKPTFNGGWTDEFENWIKNNIDLSESLKQQGFYRHKVVFTVDKEGQVINAHQLIHISKDEDFDKRLVNTVRRSPSWQPAFKDGKPVKYETSVTVDFARKATPMSISSIQTATSNQKPQENANDNSSQSLTGDDISIIMNDPIFKRYCLENFDANKDGKISFEEAARVKDIDVHSMSIKSLKGIEFFTNLTQLRCMSNQLTSLDVSKNTALEVLHSGWNQLTSLDVSKNTALEVLSCNSNSLRNLDVSKNTKLRKLDCSRNQLVSLDISNTHLREINYDSNNNLTSGSIKGQLPKCLPSWVYFYKWGYTATVRGSGNVPGNRDFLIELTDPNVIKGQVFEIKITNRSPLQADCWTRTYKGTFTFSDDGTIVLQYGSEKTVLYVDNDDRCLRFKQNGERLEKHY